MKKFGILVVLGLSVSFVGVVMVDECGELIIVEMNWLLVELMVNVDKLIFEVGYGCEVELVLGVIEIIFVLMNEKGELDVVLEFWVNVVCILLDIGVDEGCMYVLNNGLIIGLGEGWWVIFVFVVVYLELDIVEKIFEYLELFLYVEDELKGVFMGCLVGWGCQLVNVNLFCVFDMEEKGWVLVDLGLVVGLDGLIVKVVECDENWLGYYWLLILLVGKYGLIMILFEVEWVGDDNWNNCVVLVEQDCVDLQLILWIELVVMLVVIDNFMQVGGVVLIYFENCVFLGEVMNGMLVYMSENQVNGEDVVYYFLEIYLEVWGVWVLEDVVVMVQDEF